MEISQLQAQLYQDILKKGFMLEPVYIPALMHSELSEALESFRNKEPLSWTDNEGKPQGIASEYIDLIIRAFNYCSHLGIDVETELFKKMLYNNTRPYKHGGKLI